MILPLLALLSFSALALTPDEVKKSVIENFPLIQEAEMKLRSSEGDLEASKGEFDHKLQFKARNRIEDKYDNQYFETSIERNTGVKGIGLIAGHRQGVGTFPPYDGKYETSGAGELFAGISVPLLRNFSTDFARSNLEIAKLDKKQAAEQLRLKQNIYVHKALSLYYKILLENEKLKIRTEVLELALERNAMLEKKFQRGDVEKIKVTDNQRSIDKRKDELLKTKLDLVNLQNQMKLYLPEKADQLSTQFPDKTLVSLPVQSELSSDKLPQLSILKFERDKQKLMVKLREQERLPGLSIDVLGAKELSQNNPYDPESIQLGLKFDFPLENRKAEGKSVSEQYKMKAIEKNLSYLEMELKQTFDYSKTAMSLSKERWQILQDEAERTQMMSKAERTRWQQGSADLFTVNLREQDLADVMIRKWTTWYDYHQNLLDVLLYSNNI